MLTPAKKKSNKAYHDSLESKGFKRVMVWLSPDDQAVLTALSALHESPSAAIRFAIRQAQPNKEAEQ